MDEQRIARRDRQRFNAIADRYALKDVVPSTKLARDYQIRHAISPIIREKGTLGQLLDIGCGNGAAALYLRESSDTYCGIDYAHILISQGARLGIHHDDASFAAGDVRCLPLKDHLFDTVLAVGALHHMTDLDAVMQEVRRVAKRGGWFIAIEPQRANPVISLLRTIRALVDSNYSRDQHFFRRDELTALLTRNGLSDVTVHGQGYFSKPFGQVILPMQRWATFLSKIAIRIDQVLDRHLPRKLEFLSWDIIVRARF